MVQWQGRWRTAAWRAIVWGLWLAVAASAAPPPTRPVSQLKPGLKGKGKTCIRGTEISTFDFEVLDVLQADGYNNDLILIRVSGPVIEACGGIAAGMSGSPLYIDNDLIGAVAMTTPNSDTHIGFATPIADMLKVLTPATKPVRTAALGVLDGFPVGTPVQCFGLQGRSAAMVASLLRRHGLTLVQGGGPTAPTLPGPATGAPTVPGVPPAQELPPGSPVAASLTNGDVVLTALGTVTWRDGDKLLAFGHPFMRRGDCSLFMHPGLIYGVVPSRELSFKIGAPGGPPIGSFIADRSAGIGGVLGRAAESFAVEVRVVDEALARERTLKIELVRDPELAPVLAAVCVVQAMEEVMDRQGGGTATIGWTLTADGLPREVSRDDVVYSASELVGEAAAGPLFALDTLLRNDFGALTPKSLKLSVSISKERRTARLVGLKVEQTKVKAGDSLRLTCLLQPFRGTPYMKELSLQVPKTASPGRLLLEVHGRDKAANGPLSQAMLMAGGLPTPTSLAELVRTIGSTQRGDTLLAELLAPEVAAAREQASAKMAALPSPDLFGEQSPTLPSLDLAAGAGGTAAVARTELRLDKVVLGHLRETITVVPGT